jgi:hypothetical protein
MTRSHRSNLRFLIRICLVGLLASAFSTGNEKTTRAAQFRVEIVFSEDLSRSPIDGRVYLLISTDNKEEPRFEIEEDETKSQQIFGVDVEGVSANVPMVVDTRVLGYPTKSLADIPSGNYYVQAVLQRYTTFHRADGHVVKLPRDEGEGQRWNSKPGNFYSDPALLHIDPRDSGSVRVTMTHAIPPVKMPSDTPYIKHVRIKSEMLTKFWGAPMYLGAIILLPEGWETHPDAHYPLMIEHTHFPSDFPGFITVLPTALNGRNRALADYAYKFYQDWTSGRLPRMIMVEIQHANPYYDDSYGVNSANIGPYGDAIVQELIPYVEQVFRGIGQGWARGLYGASTGGWESLASQVFYPSFYNGAWGLCPDPVDFRAYESVNIFEDQNAFWRAAPWGRIPEPDMREPDGRIVATVEGSTRRELVLGTQGRSGGDWNGWQAVFSPVGPDGYPKPIWDPLTGVIDHEVAEYWREHYDLRYILEREWKSLGPQLVGKLHVTVGTRDTFYLDNAVRLLQKFLESTNNPYYAGDIEYGPHQPHCFTGDTNLPAEIGNLTMRQRFLVKEADWMLKTSPRGADVISWRY